MPPTPQARENLKKAVILAASTVPADHEQLFSLLDSKAFLFSLEPEQNYNNLAATSLQVARVIRTLMKSPHAIAWETLVRLVEAREFLSLETLEELLIMALIIVRPLPPAAVAFLDRHSAPDSTPLHLVLQTLAANESEPALQLFERKIADAEIEIENRIIWLRSDYLVRRNDVPILKSYKRMIVDGIVPPDLRIYALESLCAYSSGWYLACTKPRPPLRVMASGEAKKILREILDHAQKNMALSPEIKLAAETTAFEIGG